MAEEGQTKEVKVNLDEGPKRKTPKNFVMVIIAVAVTAVVMSMWMGTDSTGGEEEQVADEREKGPESNMASIRAQIAEQEAEALRQRRAAEEARRKAEEAQAEVEKAKADAKAKGDDGPKLSEKELELARQATASQIVAIQGKDDNRFGGSSGGPPRAEQVSTGGSQSTINDPMLTELRQKASRAMDMQMQQLQGGNDGPTMTPDEAFMARAGMSGSNEKVRINEAPVNKKVIFEGSIIPSVLQTGVKSDLPGMVTAMVSENVYDSITGNRLIIPRGTKLVGQYNNQVKMGQERVMFAFTRMILPDGRSADLSGMSAAGENGYAGLTGDVDTHFWEMLGKGLLIAGLSIGVDTLANNAQDGQGVTNVYGGGGGTQQSISSGGQVLIDTADQALSRYDGMKPTITIKPGSPLNIMVNRDIVLP